MTITPHIDLLSSSCARPSIYSKTAGRFQLFLCHISIKKRILAAHVPSPVSVYATSIKLNSEATQALFRLYLNRLTYLDFTCAIHMNFGPVYVFW